MNPQEQKIREEHKQLSQKLAETSFSSPEYGKASKQLSDLQATIALFDRLHQLETELADSKEALKDAELAELAQEDLPRLESELKQVNSQLAEALEPKDPNDQKDAIVEIRAGAGGDESSLFAGELYRMYIRYGERMGWKPELLNQSQSDAGGFKEIVFALRGSGAYGRLKFESGVHRVQRVPVTESQGRIHTSTATVAVLPEAEETDIEIRPDDLNVDVFRSGGHGGQSVNTTDSAVRITHKPTGIVVVCQDERSQLKNKMKAMNVLRSRLLAKKLEEEQAASSAARKGQIGTGDRSEKIRTYNFPQDRVTDHRIGMTRHNLVKFMDGEIDDMMSELMKAGAAPSNEA